ncbi:MAG: ASKHA domain-containing protein [Desulfohalobiaceae bacterium]|nr:ASKHA domain-containing protein [Desulfohalobiaceae bacterium]
MTESVRITVNPVGETIQARPGENLRETLLRYGINIEGPCNGEGICGQCGIWVESPSDVPPTPHSNISLQQEQAGLRLSCRIVPQTDMTIRLPEDFSRDAQRIRETKQILEGERISWGRVASAVHIFREEDTWFLRYDRQEEAIPLPKWHEELEPKGLAVDLGTTTIVLTMVSLRSGEELATASMLNPQSIYGHDVITRIRHGSTPEGLRQLADSVSGGLNELIRETCTDSGSETREILDAVIGGNTTMLQLAAHIDPSPLGKIPFRVDIDSGTSHPASRFGLEVNPAARVYIPPVLHAFIGTDVTSGLLMSGDFFNDSKGVLYIDVGTNGEIAVNNHGHRKAASTAAGPAFEGSTLTSGMQAALGAVSAASTDGYHLEFTTIGDLPAKGICGSGIVDLLASLLELGIVDRTGRMKTAEECPDVSPELKEMLEKVDGQPAIRLGEKAVFTQGDIREIQLSKGAIRSTIDILLTEAELQVEDLQRIIVAGGFGFHLQPKNLERIGLIPPGTHSRVDFAGNASRSGCVWLVNDITYRRYLESRVSGISHLSTAEHPSFMDRYVESMEFP